MISNIFQQIEDKNCLAVWQSPWDSVRSMASSAAERTMLLLLLLLPAWLAAPQQRSLLFDPIEFGTGDSRTESGKSAKTLRPSEEGTRVGHRPRGTPPPTQEVSGTLSKAHFFPGGLLWCFEDSPVILGVRT